uniref:Gustatory receptor n=1 Tax=Cacopsylla melanoneura TaxID=428564 RepID=A0A8D8Z8E5_9HEMI
MNAQHYQVCILLSDAFESLNKNLIRDLQSPTISDAEKIELISKLNEVHHRLCDIIRLVNDLYKYSIMMELLNNGMGLTTMMFHTLDFSVHLSWWLNSSQTISRMIQIVLRLYFLCFSSSEVLTKSKETLNALIKGYELTYEKRVQRQIQAFITRIQNERVAFDICGLFCITSKTFISILRITTSFVLILIQFNPHPSVRKDSN